MNKDKILWCSKQNKGIRLIELKPHLSESYIKEADNTLENVFSTTGKWKIITGYYACYNAFYSILMKCGIRCEIHDCSIELMNLFDFNSSEINYLKNLKTNRIQTQYYLKPILLENETEVKKFILKCKDILNNLDSKTIENIRKKLMEISEGD